MTDTKHTPGPEWLAKFDAIFEVLLATGMDAGEAALKAADKADELTQERRAA